MDLRQDREWFVKYMPSKCDKHPDSACRCAQLAPHTFTTKEAALLAGHELTRDFVAVMFAVSWRTVVRK